MRSGRKWLGSAGRVLLATAALTACDSPTEPGVTVFADGEGYGFPQLDEGDFIVQFAFQPDETLWVRTLGGALIRVVDGTSTYHAESMLGGDKATDLFRAPDGRLWIAFEDGYGVLDGTHWTWWNAPAEKLPGTAIRQIAVNGAGEVLMAAGHADAGGLLFLRGGVWSSLTPDNSALPSSVTHEIEPDGNGDFWVAQPTVVDHHGGLSRISAGQVTDVLSKDSGLLYDWADALEVVGNRLYIGFEVFPINRTTPDGAFPDGGLQILSTSDGDLQSRFPFETGITSNRIVSMVYAGGFLWFTTGLDEARPGCETCFSGIGRLAPDGTFEVRSALTTDDLEPNEFLPWIDTSPSGGVYVIVDGRRIERVRF